MPEFKLQYYVGTPEQNAKDPDFYRRERTVEANTPESVAQQHFGAQKVYKINEYKSASIWGWGDPSDTVRIVRLYEHKEEENENE